MVGLPHLHRSNNKGNLMGVIEEITKEAYLVAWNLLDKSHTLLIKYPTPGTVPTNVLFGASKTGGITTVTLSNCVGGWFKNIITDDGYRQQDKQNGKAIFLLDSYTVPELDDDDNEILVPLTFAKMRELVAKPNVEVFFDDQAVTVTIVTNDSRCNTIVVEFSQVP